METELQNLKIDRQSSHRLRSVKSRRWLMVLLPGAALIVAGGFLYAKFGSSVEVRVGRVRLIFGGPGATGDVVLNATGYLMAAHKIEVASKVVGRVAWIGVEKGDKVKEGQVIVRLEDDEYRARLAESRGMVATLEARLAEMEHGSLPEEIARAAAEVDQGQADAENARVTLQRIQSLHERGVLSRQDLDDARAQFDRREAGVRALQKTLDLVRMGPRREQIDAMRAQLAQARGTLTYAQVQLENTVIKAPIGGTVLERNVEKGEFVTTGFVGDRGAKGYVVSLADLRDLQVELDISQNDFSRLSRQQQGVVTTDAYPDRKYQGRIQEISPEANRQKATIQVKVKVLNPDDYLRPDMNASVSFYNATGVAAGAGQTSRIVAPAAAVRDGAVFIVAGGKAVRRAVRAGSKAADGIQIEAGLQGGEEVILDPPGDLRDGARVRVRE